MAKRRVLRSRKKSRGKRNRSKNTLRIKRSKRKNTLRIKHSKRKNTRKKIQKRGGGAGEKEPTQAERAAELSETERKKKETELLGAASTGDFQTMELLLKEGVSTDAQDGDGNTALHLAAANDQLECAQLLVAPNLEVDLTKKNEKGKTALDIARPTFRQGGRVAKMLTRINHEGNIADEMLVIK